MTVNDFVKFKLHEYNQSDHEKVSYVDIAIWQMIHYHFFTLQDELTVRSRFYNCKCYDFQWMQDFVKVESTLRYVRLTSKLSKYITTTLL